MRRIARDDKKSNAAYYAKVTSALEAMGATVLKEDTDGDGKPARTYEVMTDAGRLELRVYDDSETLTCFDRPKMARKLVDCDPSGKWNFHTDDLLHSLGEINARAVVYTDTALTPEQVGAVDIETWKDRVAMGERFTITGWDKTAAVQRYAAHCTTGDVPHEAKMHEFSLRWRMMNMPDIEAYMAIKNALQET